MKKKSETDWEAVDAMADDDIDVTDAPPLDEEFFKNAVLRMPIKKEVITIRIDQDVLKWFKSQGSGYQTRINAVLRTYMQAKT